MLWDALQSDNHLEFKHLLKKAEDPGAGMEALDCPFNAFPESIVTATPRSLFH